MKNLIIIAIVVLTSLGSIAQNINYSFTATVYGEQPDSVTVHWDELTGAFVGISINEDLCMSYNETPGYHMEFPSDYNVARLKVFDSDGEYRYTFIVQLDGETVSCAGCLVRIK